MGRLVGSGGGRLVRAITKEEAERRNLTLTPIGYIHKKTTVTVLAIVAVIFFLLFGLPALF